MESSEINPNSDSAENTQPSSADSSDTIESLKVNQMHTNNTLHNLDVKLENMTKKKSVASSSAPSSASSDVSSDGNASSNPSHPDYDKLQKEYDDLRTRISNLHNKSELNKYAKRSLKKNNLNVSSSIFNKYIIGKDKDTIDENIKQWKPIQKKLNSTNPNIPKQTHHHKPNPKKVGSAIGKATASLGVKSWKMY